MKKIYPLLAVLTGVLFGATGIFVRTFTAAGMNNITIVFTRVSVSAFCLLILNLLTGRSLKLQRQDILFFLSAGLLGMALVNLCYNEAMRLLPLSLAAVLLSTAPAFVLFLAAVLFHEKITGKKILCVCFVILGCALMSGLFESGSGQKIPLTGILLGLVSGFFYAVYNVSARVVSDRGYASSVLTFYCVFLIALVVSPLVSYRMIGSYIASAPARSITVLLLHGILTSVIPYVSLTIALRSSDTGVISTIASGAEPAAALIFGILLYDEIPSALMLAGMAITIGALAVLCRRPQEKQAAG